MEISPVLDFPYYPSTPIISPLLIISSTFKNSSSEAKF
jgi:hypothetical protein